MNSVKTRNMKITETSNMSKENIGSSEPEREVDPTDFYFEDPSLQLPELSSGREVVFPLSPSKRSFYCLQQKQYNVVLSKGARHPSLSPGSDGTGSTSATEDESYCGSLTYSVESGEIAYLLDEDDLLAQKSSKDHDNTCFQLFVGLLSLIRNAVDPEPAPRSSIYFEFDEQFGKTNQLWVASLALGLDAIRRIVIAVWWIVRIKVKMPGISQFHYTALYRFICLIHNSNVLHDVYLFILLNTNY